MIIEVVHMDTRINKYNESDKMSRVSKNSDLYKQINDSELDNFNVHSNATVIGNQEREIDVEQIKKILDKRYNDRPQRRSIRVEPREEVSRLDKEDTKEYDLTKVLEKAKDEKVETYEEVRAKKLRNTQYDILNNLNIEETEEKEENKIQLKKIISKGIKFCFVEIGGVLASSALFLPVVYCLLQGKGQMEENIFQFVTNGKFLEIFSGFMLGHTANNTHIVLYCGEFIFLAVVLFFLNTNYRQK